ncbi:MAG TPA: D-aminoacyl-tRNA deacylase [Patescibacteria group bacterium]|nr:D-aminoacyl-tRNA deacylase [Patescibacteria group bacterium]
MRLVIQRVKKASVERVTDKRIVGSINKGFFILVGIGKEDKLEDVKVLAEKVSKLRIMSDEQDKMNLSLKQVGGELLVVSQFTLYADTSHGNRPSFINAGLPEKAKEIYEYFVEKLKGNDLNVETGSFGDYMKINAELDGPVTIIIES